MAVAEIGPARDVTWIVRDGVDVPLALGWIEAALTALNPQGKTRMVFLWRAAKEAVVLGSACRLASEVDAAGCEARGIGIYRRLSGGGTVLLGPQVYCYSFFFPKAVAPSSIHDAFARVHARVIQILRGLGVDARSMPVSDIASAGPDGAGDRKLAGHAQKRTRQGVLCEGCLMASPFDFPMADVLKPPQRQPPYRQGRSHEAFVISLEEAGGFVDFAAFAGQMRAGAKAQHRFPEAIDAHGRRLVRERYHDPKWTARL